MFRTFDENGSMKKSLVPKLMTVPAASGRSQITPVIQKFLYDNGIGFLDGKYSPHVNGYYHVSMQVGAWINKEGHGFSIVENDGKITIKTSGGEGTNTWLNYSENHLAAMEDFQQNNGLYSTDIDLPNITVDYESISGKVRSLNYATRINYAGDFSISYIDNYNGNIMKFHDAWFKYIDAYKKGLIYYKDKTTNPHFISIPYFNAVWIAIFYPFTTDIQCLIKIMGVAPINLPFKQMLGDRSKSTMTTLNFNYKSTDLFWKFYDLKPNKDIDPEDRGAFYKEYMTHMNHVITGYK